MTFKKEAILLMGAPGSGKGTQGEILEKRSKYKYYIMSSMIKKKLKSDTHLYENVIKKGKLLNDLDVFEIFRKSFKGEDKVIIDGIPRTLDQAYWLYGYLRQHDYAIRVVYIDVKDRELLKRVKERGREDDKEDVFKERLKIYKHIRAVVRSVYSRYLIEIDGNRPVEEVSKEVQSKLGV